MTNERLEEIKDSINLQYELSRLHNIKETFLIDEEKELYDEVVRLTNVIKEVREEMENAKHISIDDSKAIIEHEKRILEILDKVEENK